MRSNPLMAATEAAHRVRVGGASRRHAVIGVALALGCAFVAGCTSSKSNSGSAGQGQPNSGEISQATLTSLRARLEAAQAVPKFTAPGQAVDASVVRGKKAMAIPISSQVGQCQTQAEDFKNIGSKLGMAVSLFSNPGGPSSWASGIQAAISQHVDAIALICGIVPGAVAPQLQAAKRAGIAVVDSNYNDAASYAGLDAETGDNAVAGFRNLVDSAIVNLNGKPLHAVLVTSEAVPQGVPAGQAAAAELKAICPNTCTVEQNLVPPLTSTSSAVQQMVASALVAHPNVNAIIGFDAYVADEVPAISLAHRTDTKLYAWGASPGVLKLMSGTDKNIIAAVPGPNPEWSAYQAFDQVIRLLGHNPPAPVTAAVTPDRFWTSANVDQYFTPDAGYGSFADSFLKLWGSSP